MKSEQYQISLRNTFVLRFDILESYISKIVRFHRYLEPNAFTMGNLNMNKWWKPAIHYNDVIMGAIAPQITSLMVLYSTVYSDADQRKHQSSASLAFVRGIQRGSVNSLHKWPVTRNFFSIWWRHHAELICKQMTVGLLGLFLLMWFIQD